MGLDHWIKICSNEQKYASIKKQIIELNEDIEDELTVIIVGEFNAGKSTFINALLGEKVLSSDVTPETAMVTKLTFGEERKVIAHYLDGYSKVYDDAWLEQLTAEREGRFKEIRHQLSHVELQIPFKILTKLTIIDTPGLNANNEFHTKATERFLGRADHAIFLFHAMNIGTATEKNWLKKFNEHGIYPFGIINRIDEIDEEEDDLDGLIEFNKPRLGPTIQKLMGVSAIEALNGKLQNDSKALEWSNWSVIDELLKCLIEMPNKKKERAFSRLLHPLRQMDQFCLERKILLPLKKLSAKKIEDFVTKEFPELLLSKERLDDQQNITRSVYEGWNQFLHTTIRTMEDFDEFLRNSMEHCKGLEHQVEWRKDPLQVWDELVSIQYPSFMKSRNEYNNLVDEWCQYRKDLEQGWKVIQQSHFLNKKAKLEKHLRKLEFYHYERKNLIDKHGLLSSIFREMVKKIDEMKQNVKTLIENDLNSYVEVEQRVVDIWNRQLENIQFSFVGFSNSDLTQIEVFSKWLNDFQENVAEPLLNAGKTFENFLAYEETRYILSNLEQLSHDVPPLEFYFQWRMLDDFSKEGECQYNLHFPKLTPQEFIHHELKVVPGELQQNVQTEIDAVLAKRNQWLKRSAGAVFLSLVIAGIAHSIEGSSSEYDNRDDSEYVSNSAVDDEQQSLEEEKQALQDRFPKADVEDFLTLVHQQVKDDQSSHDSWFSNDGWEGFLPFYDNLSAGELETLSITNIDYLSGEEIKVVANETYKQSGILKEFETVYTLTKSSNSAEGLMITTFTSTLANETEIEIDLEDGEIEEFLHSFRSAYMQALNEGDSSNIPKFFEQDSPAYKNLQTYIDSIAGKGYSFEEQSFQVDKVEKVQLNEYKVSASEKFLFTDENETKTIYERTKDYIVKVLPEKVLVIKEITINDTKKEVVKEPTVQLVTNQDVAEFILNYYSSFEKAFNGNGFTYVQNDYDPEGSGYESAKAYISNAISKNMRMKNIDINVESIHETDDNHYLVTVYLVDEYTYQDGSGDRKQIRANYKIRVTKSGDMFISEDPSVTILEKTVY
jgi:GTPase SAR1 family protein